MNTTTHVDRPAIMIPWCMIFEDTELSVAAKTVMRSIRELLEIYNVSHLRARFSDTFELPYKESHRRVSKQESLPYNSGNPKQFRLPVTKQAKREYIKAMQPRYRAAASRLEQSSLLDEIERMTKFNRKYLIRILLKKPKPKYPRALYQASVAPKAGRPTVYNSPQIKEFLRYLWHATNQACGKRMQALLPLWLPAYAQATGIQLSPTDQELLTSMTHTTIDRLLAEERSKYRIGKGRATTKPGTLMKKRIPIKTEQWKEKRPGYLEVDTVAHCGTSTAGMFVYSLNAVDVGTTWVETRAAWGKGETGILEQFQDIEQALPFILRGFDSDNGSEFINHHIDKYLSGRKRQVEHTRSREYKKNDNAHIEQKNWTHVRQFFGYERFDNPQVVPLMNALYAREYSLLVNFFLPSVKLQKKERIGSKIIKRHDQPKTPCARVLASPAIPELTKERLRKLQQSLNPFKLYESMRKQIKLILQQCSVSTASRSAAGASTSGINQRRNLRPEPPKTTPSTNSRMGREGKRKSIQHS